MQRNGKWVTADNRRLWVFRQLERLGKCGKIPIRITNYIPEAKLTAINGGDSVVVRGPPGGFWHNRPTPSTKKPAPRSSYIQPSLQNSPTISSRSRSVVTPVATKQPLSYNATPLHGTQVNVCSGNKYAPSFSTYSPNEFKRPEIITSTSKYNATYVPDYSPRRDQNSTALNSGITRYTSSSTRYDDNSTRSTPYGQNSRASQFDDIDAIPTRTTTHTGTSSPGRSYEEFPSSQRSPERLMNNECCVIL